MSKRVIAKPGQSYLDANPGRVIAIQDDVLHIRQKIISQWPELDVVYDQIDGKWIVIQTWTDDKGVERESLAMMADELDDRLINRLHEADPNGRGYVDPVEYIDKHNEEIKRQQDKEFADKIGDFGERFIHAMKKDGIHNHDNIEREAPKHRVKQPLNAGKRVE